MAKSSTVSRKSHHPIETLFLGGSFSFTVNFCHPCPCLVFFLWLLKHSECLFSTISSTTPWFYQSICKKVATILDRYKSLITTAVVLRSKAHPHVYYTLRHIRVMSIQPSGSISIAVRLRNTGCWHLSTSWFLKTEPFFLRRQNIFVTLAASTLGGFLPFRLT